MEVPTGSNQLLQQELIASLFGRYENRLYTFALKITRSEDLARDIVQEVFLKLCESESLLNLVEGINEIWKAAGLKPEKFEYPATK